MPETAIYLDVGRRLEALRKGFSSLNKYDWAAHNNFDRSQYYSCEQGKRRIPVEQAERLADVYGLTLDWIYRGKVDGLSENVRNVVSSQRPRT